MVTVWLRCIWKTFNTHYYRMVFINLFFDRIEIDPC